MKLINIKRTRIVIVIFSFLLFIQLLKNFLAYKHKHTHYIRKNGVHSREKNPHHLIRSKEYGADDGKNEFAIPSPLDKDDLSLPLQKPSPEKKSRRKDARHKNAFLDQKNQKSDDIGPPFAQEPLWKVDESIPAQTDSLNAFNDAEFENSFEHLNEDETDQSASTSSEDEQDVNSSEDSNSKSPRRRKGEYHMEIEKSSKPAKSKNENEIVDKDYILVKGDKTLESDMKLDKSYRIKKADPENFPNSYNENIPKNENHQKFYRQENSKPFDTFKNIMTDKDPLEYQIQFFEKFSRENVVTIVQANSGYVEILSNMFCTLLATNPNYLKGLVVWTTDMEFGSSWLNHMRNSHSHSPLSTHFMNDFGVYYSTSLAENSVNASRVVSSGSKEYYKLMNLRGEFFVFMLEKIGMPFLFLDGDMVFFRDPFPWIIANNGLGLGAGEGADRATVLGQKSIGLNFKKWGNLVEREPSLKNYLGFDGDFKYMGPNNPEWVKLYAPSSRDRKRLIEKMEMISKGYQLARNPKLAILKQDPFLMLPPDLVYATDPHHPPAYNPNPYRGSGDVILTKVPKICGGTFYVKPNNRTINLFKKLLKEIENGGNDQWSMDKLLNKLDTVLVGQLPRCTGRSGKDHDPFCPEKGILEPPARTVPLPLPTSLTLRVRVLDFWQFSTNAALYYGPGDALPNRQEKAFFFTKMFSSYSYLKEDNIAVPYHVPVAFHANAWNRGKINSLKAAASWYLDEKGVCNIV